MRSAIITGATSFLGAAVTDLLLKKNIKVTAVVRPESQKLVRLPKSGNLSIVELDMANISHLSKMGLSGFGVFYHLAWDGTRAGERNDSALQESNYLSAMDAVKTAAALGCTAFIGAGSQAEYGLLSGKIDEEACSAEPVTAYGKAKLKVCNDGWQYAEKHGMRFVWARIFSLYGADDHENTLIMSCLKKMCLNAAVELTECIQMWDFLHVSDAAQAFYLMGESDKADGIYHVASGQPRSLKEFVLEMQKISNSKSLLNFGAVPYPFEGKVGFEPLVTRLTRELNWMPQMTFQEGVTNILHHTKRNDNKNEDN